MQINVFGYHLSNDEIKQRLGRDVNVNIIRLGNIKQPLEFYGYLAAGAARELSIICNDTALTKEYKNFIPDCITHFSFIKLEETPTVAGVVAPSLFGIDLKRQSPHGKHLQSHFYILNKSAQSVFYERLRKILDHLKPSELSVALAKHFFDERHWERKALAMQAEIELSDHLFEHCTVFDVLSIDKIRHKRLVKVFFHYFCRS